MIQKLGPELNKRLEQILLQLAGAGAFNNDEVVAALQLSEEQKERIRAIQGPRRERGSRPAGPRPEEGKKAEDARKIALDQVLSVLTTEQREKWQQLIGELFKGDIRRGPAGPRRP